MKNFTLVLLGIATTVFLTGCGQQANEEGVTTASVVDSALSPSSNESSSSLAQQKVSLKTASHVDISRHIEKCHGKRHKGKICVRVCHRPPGNPNKYKEMILPLEATKGHSCHDRRRRHVDRDYLGRCHRDGDEQHEEDDNDSDDDDSGGGSTPPPTDGGIGGGSTPPPADGGGSTTPPDNGGSTGGGSTTPPPAEEDGIITIPPTNPIIVPSWCLPFISIDANCDGINDSTGISYL